MASLKGASKVINNNHKILALSPDPKRQVLSELGWLSDIWHLDSKETLNVCLCLEDKQVLPRD